MVETTLIAAVPAATHSILEQWPVDQLQSGEEAVVAFAAGGGTVIERGADEAAHHLGDIARAAVTLHRVEPGIARRVNPRCTVDDQLADQPLLAAEMIGDRSVVFLPCSLGDLPHCHGVDAALREQAERDRLDRLGRGGAGLEGGHRHEGEGCH